MTPGLAAVVRVGFHTPHVRYMTILPVIVMLGGAVLLLVVGSLVRRPLRVPVASAGTVVVSLVALGFALWQWADVLSHGASTAVDQAVALDGFSALVQILVPCAMVLTALVADGYLRREGTHGPEFNVLALIAAAGAMLMGQANDLVVIFLGLEILSLPLYVLVAFNHRRVASGEAALKYFILGAFSSAIFVYGIALTYGATGSTNLTQIADFLSHNVVVTDGLLLAGLALLLVGFSFKIAAVPFHMWTPDVYQGAPSPVTGFMAAVAKIGGFTALLRVFVSSFGVLRTDWQPIVYALAVVTLLLGAVLAVVQRDIKRMLAYSSINTVGFILLGLQAGTTRGVSASLYYLFAYTFMVIGSFAVVTILGRGGDRRHDIAGYRGLARRQPLLALSFAVLLLAQAGAPFTTGLWAKLQVVLASVDANSVPLATIAMVSAALAAFFYLRVAVLMYTPLRQHGAEPGLEPDAEDPVVLGVGGTPPGEPAAAPAATVAGDGATDDGARGDGATGEGAAAGPRPVWAGTEHNVAVITRINAGLLLDDEPSTEAPDGAAAPAPGTAAATAASIAPESEPEGPEPADDEVVPVPKLAAVAIGLCVAVTVVFGIIPAPLIDMARQATLLFPR
ncbi:MAG: NADH-quinone oxidoreductase subunit N [Acidimicrobiales bacterium]